jgi:hypothetical protein
VNGILAAANDPTIIFAAINGGNEEMEIFQGKFTASDLDDLATWLAFAPNCPSGGVAVSVLPTSYVFLAQDIDTTSAPTTITVSSAGHTGSSDIVVTAPPGFQRPRVRSDAVRGRVARSSTWPSAPGVARRWGRQQRQHHTVALSGVNWRQPASRSMYQCYREFDSYFVTALADRCQLDNGIHRMGAVLFRSRLRTPGSLTVAASSVAVLRRARLTAGAEDAPG